MFKAGMVSGKANCSQAFSDPEDCFESRVSYNYGNYLDFFETSSPVTCQALFCSPHHPGPLYNICNLCALIHLEANGISISFLNISLHSQTVSPGSSAEWC